MPAIILSQLAPINYEVLVNSNVFKQHVDQMLKNTEPTSSEAIDLEQAEMDNNFNFPSSSDEHHSSPETATSSACYPLKRLSTPWQTKLQLRREEL